MAMVLTTSQHWRWASHGIHPNALGHAQSRWEQDVHHDTTNNPGLPTPWHRCQNDGLASVGDERQCSV